MVRSDTLCSYAFDLKSHIPYHNLSEDDQLKYWDDGLHLRDEGYDWMGGHIADALTSMLGREGVTAPLGPKSTQDSDSDDWDFEEEGGNPRNINEGYVFVRRRDLD